ncbi:MAG: type II secretion system secretin GspD [Henriciella sp.]|jgi:general secretion pathway protein D|nr:type II secretion system secretin GspD [Henriciella sp.]MBO6695849.1 type II secretion system secretin GspD [Henriciella sp.]
MKRLIAASAIALASQGIAMAEMNSPQAARHVLSLNDVEITALIDDVSIITGNTFILHPDVRRTKVTVMSQAPMTTNEVFQVFLSTLRVHGFAAIPAGRGVYRIVPEQSAIGEAGVRNTGPNAFITEVFKLDNFSAIEAAQMVKPLVDAQGQVVANARSNTLVLVDYSSNMPRLREIVSGLDADDRTKVETLELRNVPAREVQSILSELLSDRDDGPGNRFEVSASTSSNSIVIRGDEATVQRALRVARELDKTDPIRDSLRVIELKNSDAVDIVPILERLAETMADQASPGESQVPGATIAHHEPTNSLVISASPDTILAMERVVEALDKRRAQVLVEAIIVEMSDNTARELGVQFLLSGTGESTVPFLSTNFSRSAPNLLSLAGAVVDPGVFGGTNPFTDGAVSSLLGLDGASFGVGGRDGDTLFGAILTAIEKDTQSKVLSKPFNLTLDNGTSELLVGQQIPVTTGETLSSDNSNPFRTVTRQDVGIILRVTPRISADDTIRMDIFQEVSSISTTLSSGTDDFVTNQRQITTNVLADDGEIIVIGGLIEQTDETVNSKVPIAGDIPVVGNLFKSEGTTYDRTNLMVFIRPTIVRNREDAREVTSRNYRYIRAEEMLRAGDEEGLSGLDAFIGSVLGSEPPVD